MRYIRKAAKAKGGEFDELLTAVLREKEKTDAERNGGVCRRCAEDCTNHRKALSGSQQLSGDGNDICDGGNINIARFLLDFTPNCIAIDCGKIIVTRTCNATDCERPWSRGRKMLSICQAK